VGPTHHPLCPFLFSVCARASARGKPCTTQMVTVRNLTIWTTLSFYKLDFFLSLFLYILPGSLWLITSFCSSVWCFFYFEVFLHFISLVSVVGSLDCVMSWMLDNIYWTVIPKGASFLFFFLSLIFTPSKTWVVLVLYHAKLL